MPTSHSWTLLRPPFHQNTIGYGNTLVEVGEWGKVHFSDPCDPHPPSPSPHHHHHVLLMSCYCEDEPSLHRPLWAHRVYTPLPSTFHPHMIISILQQFKGTNLTFRNIPTSTATYPGSCVGNNFGSFSCENCTFENCTNIGPGGAVYSGKVWCIILHVCTRVLAWFRRRVSV